MKIALLTAFFLCSFTLTHPGDVWDILGELEFKIHVDQEENEVAFIPQPSASIEKLVGESIVLEGYESNILTEENYDTRGGVVILSRHVDYYMSCTLPAAEMYIEIHPRQPVKLSPNKRYRFKGTFELNLTDFRRLPFLLKEAECLNC